ncbi:MAG: hypothetical protein AB7S75_17670 [Desulfococcaceae bacterium]
MNQWVPFEEGEYIVVRAFLMSPDHRAIAVEKAFIEVWKNQQGLRQVKGTGMIRPFLMVEMHEEHENPDMIIDLGGEFKYILKEPVLNAGKVFSPDVSSALQFYPSVPWEPIPQENYSNLCECLKFLS